MTARSRGVNAIRSPGLWGLQVRGARIIPDAAATVLLVDDDPAKRLALKAALAPLGLPIVEADSGKAALRHVMNQTFAVILLDVRMPEMDGFETAALIRTQRESEMTPIIFITAFTNEEVDPLARYVEGAVDFIFAPVPPEELRAKVSVFANLYIQAAKYAAQAREVQASADHLKLLTDTAPIGIFRTDVENRYLYTNPRWTEITGISSEEAFGRDWATIIASSEPPGRAFEENDPTGDPFEGQRFELWVSRSVSRIVLITAAHMHDDNGEPSGWVGTLDDVTAETRAGEERSRFQSLIQNSRDVIAVIDSGGLCAYVSPGVFEVSGFRADEVIGTSGFDFIHPDDVEIVAAHLEEIVASPDESKTVEVRTRTKSGGWIWIEIRATNRLGDPSVGGIVINYHDITERRDAGQRIAESEKLLAEAQALSHLGSFTWDMRTDELTWSDEQYRLLGFEPGTVKASFETLLDRIHPDDREAFSKRTESSMKTGAPFELDMRLVEPGGKVRWINGKGEVALEGGIPVRLTGMNHDITARKIAEEERVVLLAQQEEMASRLRTLLDSTGEGIYGLDGAGYCTFMNKAGAALLGGEPDRFVGHDMHQLTHHSRPDGSAYPSDECPIYGVLSDGVPVTGASEVVWRLDGTSFPVDYSAYPIGNDATSAGTVVAFQDVTLRRRMEQDLRQSEELFRGAFDAAQTGIALTTVEGLTYVDVNQALCDMLGYSKVELLGLNPQLIAHPEDPDEPLSEVSTEPDPHTTEYRTRRYVRKDGETINVEISESLVRGPDRSPMYFVTHANDVTERERAAAETEKLESQLVQAQKMEAIGQLAGGVAHDFNNILSVILNYAQFASDGLEPGDERLADIREISKAGDKAAKLVHQLLAFSRKEIVEERVIDLNAVVTDVYQILTSSLGEDIDLVFKPLEDLPPVKADAGRIEQVLLNLAVNARDAMPDGGTLNISTGIQSVGIGDLSALTPGNYVWVTVGDSGVGMDEATVERIFEPFFTTKARGEGSGMGLSSAYGIVEQAGGCLFVDSEPGLGSTFSIYLPRSESAVDVKIDEESVEGVQGSETILLVEDEEAVRELVSRILRKKGYHVVPYSSAAEALDYCRANFGAIDLLLTDVVMPRMSGRELSEQATAICRDLKTLFMSGYTDALLAQRGVPTSGDNLITKPFKPEELLFALRGLLDSKVTS